jgi:hypothetical protein
MTLSVVLSWRARRRSEKPFFFRARSVAHRVVERAGLQLQLDLDDLLDLHQEPRVDLGEGKHLVHRHALRKRVAHIPDALGAGLAELLFEHLAVLGLLVHAIDADLQAAQGLLERLLEGAADGHHLADRFHLRGQARIGRGNFSKAKRGILVTT